VISIKSKIKSDPPGILDGIVYLDLIGTEGGFIWRVRI
jgi:hypothetical protein